MLKAILLVVILIGIGYVWYADLLPLPAETSNRLSPSIENLQRISNIISLDDHQVIYYSFEDVPDVPDRQIPTEALKKAIKTWEQNNPDLEFVKSSNANIEIKWQKYASSTHTGLATCNTGILGIQNHCVLDISVGAKDCNSDFVQNDQDMVADILMHEIGHALGLGHASEENHLMYSAESPEINFDASGYVIPPRFDGLYVGQKPLIVQQKEIEFQIESLDDRIAREQSQYDQYNNQYKYYEGKTLPPKEYEKAQLAYEQINLQVKKVNGLIDQQNELIAQINGILSQLECYPNFEIAS